MANTILTVTQITREALRVLHEKLNFIGNINRSYDDQYAKSGAKIGATLNIRLPNQYVTRDGATLSPQDTTEVSTPLAVATQKGVDLNFSSSELALSMDNFSKRVLKPAMSGLASKIEADAFSMYASVYNLVGSPGTIPATLLTYLQAKAQLQQCLAPDDDSECVIVNPLTSATLIDALKGLFHSSSNIEEQYRRGIMGKTAGFDFYTNNLIPSHTNGLQAGTPLVNGASQTGAGLVTNGWTAATTVKKGTIVTLAGVFQVHPETKASYANLQNFVVTADVTADGSGNATLAISPSITVTGGRQNVSASPASGAVIALKTGSASTAYPQHLAFHPDAFGVAFADLEMPQGVDFARRETDDGISMRLIRAYDINTDKFPCRIDVLYGYAAIRPELAVRITG
jgi:hypothetical protein